MDRLVEPHPEGSSLMANELNAEMLKVALKSIDDFAARELPIRC